MSQTIIIFGASGDLAKLKIYPALFELYSQNFLEPEFNLIGYSRSKITTADFQTLLRASIQKKVTELGSSEEMVADFMSRSSYIAGQYSQIEDLQNVFEHIKVIAPGNATKSENDQILCYFSVPPQVFEPLIVGLGAFNQDYNLKVVIEKPFGVSQSSARALYGLITQNFKEEQFYLLDHFLGKIPVRDILALRQQNSILNHLLKGKHIKSIQISALETVGVDGRLGFFDGVGSIRDMIQSHLLQVLALVCMDLPVNNQSVSREKGNILGSTNFYPSPDNLKIGQYSDYRSQNAEVANSQTETFVAVKLLIDRQDWFKTPIYIRTGKKLAQKTSKVVIEFSNLTTQNTDSPTNKLILEFAPQETISMQLSHTFGSIQTTESLACVGAGCLYDYASLINDAFIGNHLYFVTFEQIIQSWRVTDQILAFKETIQPQSYAPGTNPHFENQIFGENKGEWF